MAIVKRSTKGSPLTHEEMDNNWSELEAATTTAVSSASSAAADAAEASVSAFEAAGSAAAILAIQNDIITEFHPLVKPTLKLDFANNEHSFYDGIENSFTQVPLDDLVTVSNGLANAYDARGRLAPVSANKARLTFNPETGESEGLLVEEARTNLIKKRMSATSTGNGVLVPNYDTSLSGAVDAVLLKETTDDQIHNVLLYAAEHTADSEYTGSIELKDAGSGFARVTLAGAGFKNITTYIDLTTGELNTVSNWSVEKLADGWWRLTGVTEVSTANGSLRFDIAPAQSLTTVDYFGDGVSGILIGNNPQIEKGVFPTSPIPESATFNSRASTATYYDSTGTLQTAAIDEARYTYNPADLTAPPVLMDEVERTNYALYSDDSTKWDEFPDSITFGDSKSVNGISLTRVYNSDDGVVRRFNRATNIDVNADDYLCASVVIEKANTSLNFRFRFADSTGFIGDWFFDASTVEFNNFSTGNYGVLSLSNNLYRVWCTNLMPRTDSAAYVEYQIYDTNSGQVFYTGGLQAEIGLYPTSYIPTTSSAVTRSADNVSYAQSTRVADSVYRDLSGYEFNKGAGAFYIEFTPNALTSNQFFFSLGTSVKRIISGYINSTGAGNISGVPFANGTAVVGEMLRVIVSWNSTELELFINGSYIGNNVYGNDFSEIERLYIGRSYTSNAGSFGMLNGSVHKTELRAYKLSEAECIALTGGA